MAKQLSPAMTQAIVAVAQEAASAGHGGKTEVYQRACAQYGLSMPTLHRYLQQVSVRPERKRRSDAGQFTLPKAEAELISAYVLNHFRGNAKRGINLADALRDLRANGVVKAEAVDPATGEVKPLNASAVARALKGYGLHWRQMRQMALAVAQSTPHPNHTWQIDASVCTLFYLDDDGTCPMPEQVFYKNKPENFERVAKQRVTRFVLTDHTSGAIRLRYYLGGESIANFSEFFIWAIQQQQGDPIHGVPLQLMSDPGSGLAGAFKNLVRRLAIKLIINAAGNPRAKGQVENAQNLVEMGFEHQFRAHRPGNLQELNDRAQRWARHYNATQVHSRHGMTRLQKWLQITPAQLRSAPSVEVCRAFLTADHKECRVDQFGYVQFGGGGRRWDVRSVPGVQTGEKLPVTFSAYNEREIFVVYHDAEGLEVLHPCPLVESDEHGFDANAREIGSGYRAMPETAGDKARKKAELLVTGAATQDDAKKARKKKEFEVFGGQVRFDYLDKEVEAMAPVLPRASSPLVPAAQAPVSAALELPPLSHFQAATALARDGMVMTPERLGQLRTWYPDGVPEADLPALRHRLDVRAGLRVVAGGG